MAVSRPELYLDELSDWLATVTGKRITVSAVSNYLILLGFTRRKPSILPYERDNYLRAKFTRLISQFRPKQFIFIDESSKDNRNANRYYGYLPKGTRNYSGPGHFVRKHRLSLLAAIDISGIQGAFAVEGAFNTELFNFGVLYFILDKSGSFLLVMTDLLLFWIMPEFTIQTNS